MLGLIRKLLCIAMILLVVFIGIALLEGGERFRWIGDKVSDTIQENAEKLGEKADECKKRMDKIKEKIEEWRHILEEVIKKYDRAY